MTFSHCIKTQIDVLRGHRQVWQFDFWGYTSIQHFPFKGTYASLRFLRNTSKGIVQLLSSDCPNAIDGFEKTKFWKCVMRQTDIYHCCHISTALLNGPDQREERSWAKCMIQRSDSVWFVNEPFFLVTYYQWMAWSSLQIFRHILAFWNCAIQHVILQSV